MTPQERLERDVLTAAFGAENLPDFSAWIMSRWVSVIDDTSVVSANGVTLGGAARLIDPCNTPRPTYLAIGIPDPQNTIDLASFCVRPHLQRKGHAERLMLDVLDLSPFPLVAIIDARPHRMLRRWLQRVRRLETLSYLRDEPFEYLGTPKNWAITIDWWAE